MCCPLRSQKILVALPTVPILSQQFHCGESPRMLQSLFFSLPLSWGCFTCNLCHFVAASDSTLSQYLYRSTIATNHDSMCSPVRRFRKLNPLVLIRQRSSLLQHAFKPGRYELHMRQINLQSFPIKSLFRAPITLRSRLRPRRERSPLPLTRRMTQSKINISIRTQHPTMRILPLRQKMPSLKLPARHNFDNEFARTARAPPSLVYETLPFTRIAAQRPARLHDLIA